MTFHKVCFIEEIGTEKTFKFTLEDKDILIAKSDDGKIHAFDAMCNHQEKSMEKGRWNS